MTETQDHKPQHPQDNFSRIFQEHFPSSLGAPSTYTFDREDIFFDREDIFFDAE